MKLKTQDKMEKLIKIIKSDWTAAILGLVLLFGAYTQTDLGTGADVIVGFGTFVWIVYWIVRKYFLKG
jgi:hypothetical protein